MKNIPTLDPQSSSWCDQFVKDQRDMINAISNLVGVPATHFANTTLNNLESDFKNIRKVTIIQRIRLNKKLMRFNLIFGILVLCHLTHSIYSVVYYNPPAWASTLNLTVGISSLFMFTYQYRKAKRNMAERIVELMHL